MIKYSPDILELYRTIISMIKKKVYRKEIKPSWCGNFRSWHNHDDNQPKFIKEILHDCNVFICKRMGEKSKLQLAEKLGVTTILAKESEPIKALEEYLK